jgi:hypothetical protein
MNFQPQHSSIQVYTHFQLSQAPLSLYNTTNEILDIFHYFSHQFIQVINSTLIKF